MKRQNLFYSLITAMAISLLGNMPFASANECYGLTIGTDRFPCGSHGNCTWWAAYKRPDLVKAGISGDAGAWYDNARNIGFVVGASPGVGSVAVFSNPPHVAFVESTYEDGSFYASEMDWYGSLGSGNGVQHARYRPYSGNRYTRDNGALGGWTVKGFIYGVTRESTPPVTMCAWTSSGNRVCWKTKNGEDRSCENATAWYVSNPVTKTSGPTNASICPSACYTGPNVSSILDFLIQPAYAGGTLSSCAKRETGEDYVFGTSSPGSGSSKPPTDSPSSGKPNFVGKSIRLYDISGVERYTFKKMDTIRMVGKLSNNGSANIPSDKDVNSMFLLSKGYNEDPHGDWQVVGRDETRSDNIEVGDTQQEEETLKLWERSDIAAGRVYNIVFCADRKERDNNNGGEFEEIHESDNCTSEAVFEVEGTYNFLANLAALSNNQPKPGESFSYTAGIGNTLDQPNEDVSVALYISPNQDWNGRWLVDSFTVPASSLPTGGSFWRNGTLIAPSSGEYMLWLCVNPHGTIPETTGSDNCKSQWFKVKSELNFSLSNLTITKQSFMPGERMPVTATSLVTGGSSTQGVDLSFFITPDTWENRRGIDVAIVPPLQDGVPFTENYAVAAPQTGSYRLYACLNASGLTPEANGNDNCQSVWFESKNSDIPNPPPSQTEEEEEFEAMQAWMLLMF